MSASVVTIRNVPGSKGLPPEMAAHVVKVVAEVIARDFTGSDGKPWSERRIAEAMGMPQPVLHTIRNGKGIGINALLDLRNYTGQSIDAILGLALPERETKNNTDLTQMQQQIDALIEVVHAQVGKRPSPNSKAGKALADLERKRLIAQGQRAADEKLRRANEPVRIARKGVA